MEGLLIYGLAMVVLLVFSAFFSSSETALFATPRREIKSESVRRLLDNQRALLVTILLGNMFVNVLYSSIAALMMSELASRFPAAGGGAYVGVSLGALAGLIIFGEVIPKNIAIAMPSALANFSAPILSVFQTVISPLRIVFDRIVFVLTRTLLGPDAPLREHLSAEEIEEMLSFGKESGAIGHDEHEFLGDVLELAEMKVSEIMIPRVEMIMTDFSDGPETLIKAAGDARVSKIPVYDGNTDNILGVCHVKDLLIDEADFRSVLRRPHYIPETMKVDDLMSFFMVAKDSVALVVDEYGALVGLVTVEDVTEEVVGEILDEYDLERKMVRKLSGGRFLVDGSMKRKEFEKHFEFKLDDDKADTIGGYVVTSFGRLPDEGEYVSSGSFRIGVARIRNRRVKSLFVERTKKQEEEVNE